MPLHPALLPRSLTIFGVRVDDVTEDEAAGLCAAFSQEQGRIVVTPNPEIVMAAQTDHRLRHALAHADLAIPDGGGLLLAARLWGQPFRAQVRGSDLSERLLAEAARTGWRVFLLGGGPGVADDAATALRHRWPTLAIVGTHAGLADAAHDEATRAALTAAGRIDLLLVAFGASRQEQWLVRNLPLLDVGVGLGIGGTLDFLAGRVQRAPVWVQRAGCEWLFRLLRQPWRWRRQLLAARYFPLIALHTRHERQRLAERAHPTPR